MAIDSRKYECERKPIIEGFVAGIPYPKITGNKRPAAKRNELRWRQNIMDQTAECKGKIKDSCRLEVTFYLPENKYHPTNANKGPDLDNLAKPFQDALLGIDGDSCVKSLELEKEKVGEAGKAGASFRIYMILSQELKIIDVDVVEGRVLYPSWKKPMQKIMAVQNGVKGVYIDNMPGVSHNSRHVPGYHWEKEKNKTVFGVEIYESRGYRWLNKKKP